MVMRLVRDVDEMEPEVQTPQEDTDDPFDGAAAPRSTRAISEAIADDDGAAPRDDAEAGEQQDGVVEDISESEDSSSGEAAADADIDLRTLEALLLSTHSPLTAGRLAEVLDLSTTKPLRKAIKTLNQQYQEAGRSFRIEQVAGGYQILTLPEFGDLLKRFHQKEADAKLTKAALETLSIIAYKQPILRADIEAIRGVACGETIRSLMEKHLVKIAGRAEEPGRPILYGTTKRFLELFGLNNLKDLPQPDAEQKNP